MSEYGDIQRFAAEYKRQLYEEANKLMPLSMPELTEELFSQYEKTGNRLLYENVYFARRKFLTVMALMALLEKCETGRTTGRTLGKLIQIITSVCEEICWALPAHLSRANQDWQTTVDLFAAETAQTLSELADALRDELPGEIYTLIADNVERRVLQPFFASDAYGWEKSDHNWNAVCTGSIGSACIHLRGKCEETDACLKRICDSLIYYIGGFADDGTCMEGCGYFTYGMSYFVNFAQELYEYSSGIIDLLCGDWGHFRKGDMDKRGKIAAFQSKCFFWDGRVVNFSDGNSRDKYSVGLNLALKKRFENVRIPNIKCAAGLLHDRCYRFVFRKLDLFEMEKYLERRKQQNEAPGEYTSEGYCHILPDAQWCIANSHNGVGMACKGGHNDEAHNHNDVGHFIYEGKGSVIFADLGAGEYTRDYFGEKRYEILCNNSFGHSVPIIAGQGQITGRSCCCRRFQAVQKEELVSVEMDLTGAYGDMPKVSILRSLEFSLKNGDLKVIDDFSALEQGETTVTENLITQMKPVAEDGRIILTDGKVKAALVVQGKDHIRDVQVREYIHSNHHGQPEMVYAIAWNVCGDGQNIKSICDISILE